MVCGHRQLLEFVGSTELGVGKEHTAQLKIKGIAPLTVLNSGLVPCRRIPSNIKMRLTEQERRSLSILLLIFIIAVIGSWVF